MEDEESTAASLTRRGLFQRLGWVIALTQLPSPVEASSQGTDRQTPAASDNQHAVSPVMRRLSTYMSEASDARCPTGARAGEWHVLDTFAAMVSGSELPPGRAAHRLRARLRRRGSGDGRGATRRAAARSRRRWRTACWRTPTKPTIRGRRGWHPGLRVVPAALAVGEQFGISGAHFLRAVALGYDVGARI